MAQTTINRTVDLTLRGCTVDVNNRTLDFVVLFNDAQSGRHIAQRAYRCDMAAGTVTELEFNASMPAPQAALRQAIFNNGPNANRGVIGELNVYLTTNAASFVL